MKNKGLLSTGLIAILTAILVLVGTLAVIIIADENEVEKKSVSVTTDSVAENSDSSKAEESSAGGDDSSIAEVDKAEFPIKAENYKEETDKKLTAANAILVDTDNNVIISGKNYDKKIYPASLTKIMTLLVAAENIKDLNDTYTFTYDDISSLIEDNASRAGFEEGEKVSAKDLMYASILVSGGDGTVGIAKMVAGSEKGFVELMNKKAEEMGLKNTHFTNASGLFDKNHYSTAEDIAVILKTAMENETCKKILTANTYTSAKTKQNKNGIKMTSILYNRTKDYYVENGGKITGGKTGFISESKYSLATTYEFNGHNYICITSKSTDEWKAVEDNILFYEKYTTGDNTPVSVESKDDSSDESSKTSDDSESAPVREHI